MSGDYKLEDNVFILFTTRAFATGIPGVLSASTVAVYENVTATPILTSVAVTETLNSINGLNAVTIAATAANGFNAGGHYHVVIEAGTVDSVSVVGEVVGNFSIESAPVNWAKVAAPTTAVDLSATDIQLVDTATTVTGGATSAAQTTAQNDLDTITGSDGVTLATAQALYAPAKAGDSMALSAGAITNASLAGNMEIVFETDFATNYNTTRNAWVTNYTDVIGTDPVTAFDPPTRTELTSDINGLNDLDAAGIRAAVGLAAANMDTQFTASATATSVDLNAGAITNASLAGNMEIVFETDFATNYNTTRNAWATNAQDFVGTSAADPFNGQVIAASVTGAVGSVTGHTNQTGDTYALANGAEGFAAINTDVELILADTGELQTDWTDGGRLDLLVDAIKVVTDALTSAGAGNLALSAAGIIGGTAQTGTLSTTVMTSDLTGYENDELIGRTIIWTGGTADGQASDITDYASASGTVTYTAITTLPANGDTFVIV